MTDQAPARSSHADGAGLARAAFEAGSALSMAVGRGALARMIATEAHLSAGDRVADVGCGAGTAVREAARRGAAVTGIDPSPSALRIARLLTRAGLADRVTWAPGSAEALPLAAGAATVIWSISSVHHWDDRAAGVAEIYRALRSGGRALLADRQVKPGARGHAAHGLTTDQADDLAGQLAAAGFADVSCEVRQAGRRTMVLVRGVRPA